MEKPVRQDMMIISAKNSKWDVVENHRVWWPLHLLMVHEEAVQQRLVEDLDAAFCVACD